MPVTRRVQPCGTLGAYRRHFRNGEDPCPPCRAASAEYHRRWRADNELTMVQFRVAPPERAALERLAGLLGLPMGATLRKLLQNEIDRRDRMGRPLTPVIGGDPLAGRLDR